MTQDYLDSEILLAKKIFMYYTDRVYDYLSIGSDKYQIWYNDSLQLYFLLNFLESVLLYNGIPYIGSYEVTLSTMRNVFDKVREYYRTEVETAGEYGNIEDYVTTGTTVPYVTPYQSKWAESIYDIVIDDTSNFILPFTYANIDPKSLIVSIEGYGPISGTEVEEAYHITDGVFYWHHYFTLKGGMKVHFQYLQIAGV